MLKFINFVLFISLETTVTNASFVEQLAAQENPSLKTTIRQLLSSSESFERVLRDQSQNNIAMLTTIKETHNTGHDFGDEQKNKKSFYNWLVYSRSLLALQKLGNTKEGEKLQEELDRGKRYLPMIDFYTNGRDYRYCLSGIWSKVSTYDAEERQKFLQALLEGRKIPYDSDFLQFFKNYDFSYNQ